MSNEKNLKIRLAKVQMPNSVNGCLHLIGADEYLILVNSEKTENQRAASFLHECLHIFREDFQSDKDADLIELEVHKQLKEIADIWLNE